MTYRPYYNSGDWNAICDACGRHVKASELRRRWDGFMVCSRDWETRHPQDFVRGVVDTQAPVWTRPEPEDYFISTLTGPITTVDTVTVTDSIYLRKALGDISDTTTLTDTIYLTKSLVVNDTVLITETIVFAASPYVLNGAAINATRIN